MTLPDAAPRIRWLMVGLVFCATVINYLDRQTLSVVAPVLQERFHMSNVDYSRVVFGFMLAYTISNAVSGAFLDRAGTKIGYAICAGWWSIAAILHAFASGAFSLGVCRFLLGMGEAGNWPAGVKVVAEWFPVRERALASGIFNSGSAIGAVVAPPLVAWIVLSFGWPAAFLMVGSTGILWVIVWLLVYRTPARVEQEATAPPVPLCRLLRSRWVQLFTLSKVFSDPAWYFYIFWFPQYLNSARGFDLASIGRWAWIPFLTADLGNLIGGWVAGQLIRARVPVHWARKICVLFFAVLMMSAIPAVLCRDAYLSIGLISIATLGYTGALANMLAMPADVFPPNTVGSVWGLASMGSGFGGMIFSLATGWVIDHYSYQPVFFGFGIVPLVAALIVWSLPRPEATSQS